jgi:exopolyphosphatase/guanosine-5'-triphosphate,3'-diphosphate pyrophosphatase
MHLSGHDQRTVRVLAGVLRIAIGLDRSHDGRVESVGVAATSGALTIDVHARDDADVDLELYAASERTALLADTLSLPVHLRAT